MFCYIMTGLVNGGEWYVPVAQWLEYCVSSAKGRGFNSQGTHIQNMYSLNAL